MRRVCQAMLARFDDKGDSHASSRYPSSYQVGGTCGQRSDDEGLDGPAESRSSSIAGFNKAKDKEGRESDGNRKQERRGNLRRENVRRKRHEATRDVPESDGERTPQGASRIGLFQSQFKTHHEIHPSFRLTSEGVDNRLAFLRR